MGQLPRTLNPSASARAGFGAQLRSWREHSGLSQAELGRLVHVSGDLIGKLEKAQRRPLPDLVSRLDQALAADGGLRDAFATLQAQEPSTGRASGQSRRSGSGGRSMSATRLDPAALMSGVDDWRRWAQTVTPGAGHPAGTADDAATGVIVDRVRQLRLLDDVSAGPQILDWALHDLGWARTVLSGHPAADRTPVRRDVSAAIGQLAQLAGWVACDAGRHGQADRLWLLGLGAARDGGDVRLGATIVSCLSYQALWLGEPDRALDLAVVARRGAAGWPGGAFQALLATRQARAHAGVGDASRCERALAQAGEWIAQAGQGDDDPDWVYWVTPAVLAADAGRAWLELGRARRAADGLAEGLRLFGDAQPRNRALHLTSLATAYLHDHQPQEAIEAVDAAIDLMPVSDSRRVRQRLSGLLPVLQDAGRAGHATADRIRSVLVA
jgi:transcriptional regulator with XRE-family HTH domain/tetratricopeptide (TPR) repeat protein